MKCNPISRPTLILDEAKCKANIQRMIQKTVDHQLMFRPHFKTHQSAVIASWIEEMGVESCTVSSVKMAEYFADCGWVDILIAFPVNVLEAEIINELAEKLNLQLLVYDAESLRILDKLLKNQVGIKVELDLGSNRSGLRTNQHEEIDELLRTIEGGANFGFTGLYSHPGHTYTSRSGKEVLEKYNKIIEELDTFKSFYEHLLGFSITVGDTPGCTLANDFGPINEISPGNFVFYDAMQVNIGSCTYDDIAVVLACPVVGKNADRNEILIHGGAVHFSKEQLTELDGTTNYGKLAIPEDTGWHAHIEGAYLKSISQEHGLVHAPEGLLKSTRIGDLLYIYPAHSCLAADLMKSYLTTDQVEINGE